MFSAPQDWATDEKFRELLLYVSHRSRTDPKFGAVKLNKILFYADFAAYRQLGKSISGDEYQHLPEGPAPRHLLPIQAFLVERGDAVLREVEYFNRVQKRLEAQREPDTSLLNDQERLILDSVIEELRPFDATQVSLISHREIGWRVTRDREAIPYATAWLAGGGVLSLEQIDKGIEIAQRRGLLRSE